MSDALHADINLGYTKLGEADGSRSQWRWAAAAAYALGGAFGISGELSGAARSGDKAQTEALAAVTWAWSKKVVLDVALAQRISASGDRRRVLAGASLLF